MRRCIPVILAVSVVAVLVLPSGAAAFDHHFKVISKTVDDGQTNNGFFFRDVLLNPFDLGDRVGRDFGKCRFNRDNKKVRCKVLLHLDGTIGGYGNLLVKGNFGRGDNTLLVVNGTDDFDGAAGKVTVKDIPGRNKDKLKFDLVR